MHGRSLHLKCISRQVEWSQVWGHSGGMVKGRELAGAALDLEPGEDRRWQDVGVVFTEDGASDHLASQCLVDAPGWEA